MKVRAAGTFSDIRCLSWDGYGGVYEPLRALALRLEADGVTVVTQTFTSPAWAGQVEASDSYAAVSGELLNFAVAVTGSGSYPEYRLANFRAEFTSADEWFDIHAHGYDTNGMTFAQYTSRALTISAETYFAVYAGTDQEDKRLGLFTTRTYHEFPITEGMHFKKLRVQVGVLSGGTVRVGLMVNGVKTALLVNVTATGWTEDTNDAHLVIANTCEGQTALICYYVEVLTGTPVIRFDCFEMTAKVVDQDGDCTDNDEDNGGNEVCHKECPEGFSLQDLRNRTYKMLGEDKNEPVYWSDSEIDRYINDAYTVACRDSKCVQAIIPVALTEGEHEVTLPSTVGQILRVAYDDRYLYNMTKWEMDRTLPNWEVQEGFLECYMTTLHDTRVLSTYKTWDGTEASDSTLIGIVVPDDWLATETYNAGDVVTKLGAFYVATDISEPADVAAYEPGVGTDWEDVWVLSEDPIATSVVVWCIYNPPALTECDEPELPPWSHLGLAFAAAAKALRKYGEMRNDPLAMVYEGIAGDYMKCLKGHVANRTPERVIGMGGQPRGIRRPRVTDYTVEEA
tara:strand:+ start:59 stop:1759 length:1701 start_codon:yes stop_codon:yes gene_type:complete